MSVKMVNGIRISYDKSENVGKNSKSKWSLTDSLKEKVVKMAQEDAQSAVYMGDKYQNLLQNELDKVAPDRASAMAKATMMMNSNNTECYKQMQEADERNMRMLFGLPYKAKFEDGPMGMGTHIFDENGDEILTYTPNVGWQQYSSKSEKNVYSVMKSTYYVAYHESRQNIKEGADNIATDLDASFDVKA